MRLLLRISVRALIGDLRADYLPRVRNVRATSVRPRAALDPIGIPVITVPNPSTALAKHPAFLESMARLRSWGMTILFDPEVYPLPTPNMGPQGAQLFPWEALVEQVRRVQLTFTGR